MFLARDKNNDLFLFDDMPRKGQECWWDKTGVDGTYLKLDRRLYPEITWDSEPLAVSIVVDTLTKEEQSHERTIP